MLNEDLSNKSLYGYIEGEYNLKIDRGRRYIEAVIASEEEAKLLEVKKDAPLLYIESIGYLKDRIPWNTIMHCTGEIESD